MSLCSTVTYRRGGPGTASRHAPRRPPSIEDAVQGELEQMAGGSLSPEQLALVKSFRMHKLMLQYLSRQDNPVGWYMMQVITGRSAAAARGAGSTR
jgi:hypothetical protein